MFRFNFDVDEIVNDVQMSEKTGPGGLMDTSKTDIVEVPAKVMAHPFLEVPLHAMLDALPSQLSYSPLTIPLSSGGTLTLARRDLFDARFEIISEGTGDPKTSDPPLALQFLDNPSDLVPLVYEGGLKTWECSLDLVTYLSSVDVIATNSRVLEIGCGTAIPTLYILHNIFSSPVTEGSQFHIHLQDYNTAVLQLVTIPNLILTWYHSPAAQTFRSQDSKDKAEAELNITFELLTAFKESLKIYGINIRLFSGSWDYFDLGVSGGKYNIVLTSETIYSPESLPTLVGLMRDSCVEDPENYLCLVAAKVVYFGVGGGVSEFIRCVEENDQRARVETVLEKKSGVGRKVMNIRWL
ncbi:hypothetical protein ID866_6749 [Astraeus odoratus]|nr:hypothetical protein ID866_6749 [Astraeus odoratus]